MVSALFVLYIAGVDYCLNGDNDHFWHCSKLQLCGILTYVVAACGAMLCVCERVLKVECLKDVYCAEQLRSSCFFCEGLNHTNTMVLM